MSGDVKGGIRVILRMEGLAMFALALFAYSKFGSGWVVFAIFFLTPDLSFLGYLAGPKVSAASYNLAHSYLGAAACIAIALFFYAPLITAGIIWYAHIGFDRMLGYGLKYQTGFRFTHLGQIGRDA